MFVEYVSVFPAENETYNLKKTIRLLLSPPHMNINPKGNKCI
jgi:hypothetical protein